MAYEYEKENISKINHFNIVTGSSNVSKPSEELQEVYRKAKAMDEIEQAYWKSNTPENFAYEFVGIFEKHFSSDKERADDGRS